jgi:hypothetical protein
VPVLVFVRRDYAKRPAAIRTAESGSNARCSPLCARPLPHTYTLPSAARRSPKRRSTPHGPLKDLEAIVTQSSDRPSTDVTVFSAKYPDADGDLKQELAEPDSP